MWFLSEKVLSICSKEYMTDKEDNNQRLEEVVGMLEMGISLLEHNDDTTHGSICLRTQPTLGMLCVKSSYQ